MDIVSSIDFISCPSLRTWSENVDFPSSYLKSSLCYKFLFVLSTNICYIIKLMAIV